MLNETCAGESVVCAVAVGQSWYDLQTVTGRAGLTTCFNTITLCKWHSYMYGERWTPLIVPTCDLTRFACHSIRNKTYTLIVSYIVEKNMFYVDRRWSITIIIVRITMRFLLLYWKNNERTCSNIRIHFFFSSISEELEKSS